MKQFFFLVAAALLLSFPFNMSGQSKTATPTADKQEITRYTPENEGWLVDIDEAFEISKKSGKPIMANFTGSDWCGWCKRLTADVFSKEELKKWAAQHVVLLELDFPRRKTIPQEIVAQNQSLQQAFKVTGYPTVWVFNLQKDPATKQYSIEALGKTGYMKSCEEFTTGVEQMINK
ncbi:MAG: thioredoxin family protein [Saprospiraceae bacterium]|nr:thioredoxin family protein [Saprospiraceae bacterium]